MAATTGKLRPPVILRPVAYGPEPTPAADPFAAQRGNSVDEAVMDTPSSPSVVVTGPSNRRLSREWGMSEHACERASALHELTFFSQDASKVPPSQFQKRKGSVYATPGSRDAHTESGKVRDKSFHEKLKEKVTFYARVSLSESFTI